ncbi:MAG: hypothetical protein D3903_17175 [Candidatus Electrothrix sp. GM3_4]|nr:hypothetical protein [Candidatus Electrothrix sp. GM3_4]
MESATVEESFTATVTATFEPELITEAEWGGFIPKELDSATVAAKGTLSLTALAEYNFSAAGSVNTEFQLWERSWTSVYQAGPVTVYQEIILSMDVAASALASAELKAMAEASISESVEVGARYDGSKWIPYIEQNESESLTASLDIAGQANAEIRLIPKIEVKFYKVIGTSLTIEPIAQSSLTVEETTNNFDFLAAHPERLVQLTSFDASLGMESNIAVTLGVLGKTWEILPSTCVLGTESCLNTFDALDLFSIPTMELHDDGSVLTLEVTDGVHNPFNPNSVSWEVFPDDAVIMPSSCDKDKLTKKTVCTASFSPGTSGEYAIFASGHGVLGEVARQFKELAPQVSTACPSGNGLYCGSVEASLDDGTLYYCLDGNYQVEEQCTNGCVVSSDENDKCSSSRQAACPSGNGLYCGSIEASLDDGTLYYCQDGNYQVDEQCINGCVVSSGENDRCSSGQVACPLGNGLYCGSIEASLDDGTLYYCQDGNYQVEEQCTNGCEVMSSGENDRCSSGGSTSCPNGNGLYCGSVEASLDDSTLYYCQDGNYQVEEQCTNGCEVMSSGENDRCSSGGSTSCPNGNGLYCGSVEASLDDSTLYYCQDSNYQVEEQCTNGCEIMSSGLTIHHFSFEQEK